MKTTYKLDYDPELQFSASEGREARMRLSQFGEWVGDGWSWQPDPNTSNPVGKIRREGFVIKCVTRN